jgi:starch synthase
MPSYPTRADNKHVESRDGIFVVGKSLNILFVSAEVSPFAKVGGLADVAGSLPKELAKLGHRVTVAMPAYRMVLDDARWQFTPVLNDLAVQVGPDWTVQANIYSLTLDGVQYLLIGGAGHFENAKDSESIYTQGIDSYLFFSQAVLTGAEALKLNPDVVHCNDWHTGFIPVLMREKKAHKWVSTASVFTIHNLAYQGEFEPEILDRLGLPQKLFNAEQVEAWGRLNFLKAGCVFSDQVNTVSPAYAVEIQTPRYGCGLDGLMLHLARQNRLSGILNGIDQEVFDPGTDTAIPARFDSHDLSGKITCKARLQSELDFPVRPGIPLMAMVTRLGAQKGLDLVLEIIPQLVSLPAQLVVQGLGDPSIAEELRRLATRYPDSVKFIEEFNPALAQRIYAGSDMFLMPSAFEPCGLGQMIAMRYGTVPIVRMTGGLGDTVNEGREGFVFTECTASDLWNAIERAHLEYGNLADWGHFINACMAADHSWTISAQEYENLYRDASDARGRSIDAAAC